MVWFKFFWYLEINKLVIVFTFQERELATLAEFWSCFYGSWLFETGKILKCPKVEDMLL